MTARSAQSCVGRRSRGKKLLSPKYHAWHGSSLAVIKLRAGAAEQRGGGGRVLVSAGAAERKLCAVAALEQAGTGGVSAQL